MPTDDGDWQDALDALMARVRTTTKKAGAKGALMIMSRGMAHTKVVSGTLRRSWKMETKDDGPDVYSWWVGPTTVYARRQELGFLPPLKDSLGREFPNDPGWPYVRPAYVESVPKVRAFILDAYRTALTGR